MNNKAPCNVCNTQGKFYIQTFKSEKNKTLFIYVLHILPKITEPGKGPADFI